MVKSGLYCWKYLIVETWDHTDVYPYVADETEFINFWKTEVLITKLHTLGLIPKTFINKFRVICM